MTVLELLEQDNIKGNWTTSTYGKKHESPCPGCGGTNRFHLWPEKMEGGFFWCRQCGKSGNATSYLMHFKGMDYQQALAITGLTSYGSLRSRKLIAKQEDYAQEHKEQSNIQWQRQSMVFLEWSIKCLHDDHYMTFRNWLIKERCLHEDTINNANLGWLPQDWYTDRKDWGLPEKLKEDGSESKLWIPAGLVIPCFHNGQLQRIRIRRHNAQEGERYYIVPGSSSIPMILGNGDMFVIVESELDALLLNQEAGDLVGVIALGSAQARPDDMISDILQKSKKILVSLDNDHAGAKESWHWWMNRFPNAIRWPVILGKDPTEAHIKGLNLRDWVKVGVNLGKRPAPVEVIEKKDNKLADGNNVEKTECLKNAAVISISVTVTGDDRFKDKITSIELCIPDHPPAVFDLTQPEPETVSFLKELLKSNAEKVFYDAKKAINFLHMVGIEINGPIYDVMLADRILIAGTGKKGRDLHDVIEQYGEIADEPSILLKLREATLDDLRENNLMETFELESGCIRAVSKMELNGIRVDCDKLQAMLKALSTKKEALGQALHLELGNINLNSTQQVKEALKAKKITINNTQKGTILPLVSKHPFLSDYLSYKEIAYAISLINGLLSRIKADTGRLYPKYSQIGAPTGRFSCYDPNLQAIPSNEGFRSCFIPADGHKLIIADYSQIELRIVAEISQDKRMIDAYQKGEDLHRLTASVITGKSITEITKEERSAAKAVNFGLIYAMGPKSLKEYSLNNYGVSMTLQQAKEFRNRFFEAYEGINQWHQNVQIDSSTETRTLGNRKRELENHGHHDDIAKLFNTPVQGTSADITKKALCLLYDRSRNTGIRIVGCIHDEIIIEAPLLESDAAAEILRESMIDAGGVYLKNVPVVVEVSIADNWSEK